MNNIFLYNHGGSSNHGCEALVRTVLMLIENNGNTILLSESPQQDIHYGLHKIVSIEPALSTYSKVSFYFLSAYLRLKVKKNYFEMDLLPYRKGLKKYNKNTVAISIGGDVYCYEDYQKYISLHSKVNQKQSRTILLGCSLEPELFMVPEFVKDLKEYELITARESLTFQMLQTQGLKNIALIPDSAFILPVELCKLPEQFQEGNTVGINVSPLVVGKEKRKGIVYKNFKYLVDYILTHTECSVSLIPHVIWKNNDDRSILEELYHEFSYTGRISLICDQNCIRLKGYISRCRFFVGARTHATIAAYSTCVPTLVLGYSTKSRGIAKDLFGTYENYVIPVQELEEKGDLTRSFLWLWENEEQIRSHLKNIMPDYMKRIDDVKKLIEQMSGGCYNGSDKCNSSNL